jgi:hypothetical protein
LNNGKRLVGLAVAVLIACSVLAYFVKPKPPLLSLVSPQQELENYQAKYPGDTSLANRIINSYALAMILVQSPYTQTNVNSLENVRSWARENFQKQGDFLHPTTLPVTREVHDTVFGALGYNLFSNIHYFLQEQVGELLRFQIAAFHDTDAYKSFNVAFFDTFGRDADAATLLARYQSDRAKMAVDTVLWALLWLGAAVGFACSLVRRGASTRFNKLRLVIANIWLILGVQYFIGAWGTNEVSSLISAFVAGGIGLYLLKPVAIISHQESPSQITRIHMDRKWIALGAWVTCTFLAVQILTWIRAGMPDAPDPITLLISSITGDFLHDPVQAKRMISTLVGGSWLVVGIWTVWQFFKDEPLQMESDSKIESLMTSYSVKG